MHDWVKIGNRYINLANVCEVQMNERVRTARLLFVGGTTDVIDDDEAADLRDVLIRLATIADQQHRTVFTPPIT